MKKSDLKTGMQVEIRNGDKLLVFIGVYTEFTKENENFIVNKNQKHSWEVLENYDDYLLKIDRETSDWDIMKIYSCSHPYCFTRFDDDVYNNGTLIWSRENEKTYSIDGVEYSESTLRSLIKKATDN
jgi:hypothetical protein